MPLSLQTINVGLVPDDGLGDNARVAGTKINDNAAAIVTKTTAQDATIAAQGSTIANHETRIGSAESALGGPFTNAQLAQMPATTIKGNPTGLSATPVDMTATQLAGILGLAPAIVGQHIWGSFALLPPLCVWPNGQNLSRTTYLNLFLATTIAGTLAITSGSPTSTFTAASTTIGEMLAIGMPIEALGVPVGATISNVVYVSGNNYTVTLSANATATAASNAARIFPNGNGNGSTTFGVIDIRGRVSAGRDNMGGTAASRLTIGGAGITGSRLGHTGGSELLQAHTHQLVGYAAAGSFAQTGASIALSNVGNTNVSSAGGGASQNVQPTVIENVAIFAGV